MPIVAGDYTAGTADGEQAGLPLPIEMIPLFLVSESPFSKKKANGSHLKLTSLNNDIKSCVSIDNFELYGGFPTTASKPPSSTNCTSCPPSVLGAKNTSGNSSSQWKKRLSSAARSAVAAIVSAGMSRLSSGIAGFCSHASV